MKNVIPALAFAFIATTGASSAAQAAVNTINFSVGVLPMAGGTLSYTSGSTLDNSSAFDFDNTKLDVTMVGPHDTTGVSLGDAVTLMPTNIMYGPSPMGPDTLGMSVTKSWTVGGDTFSEELTDVQSIIRSMNAITVTLTGTVSDTMHLFNVTPASMMLSATQTGGEGAAISVSMTDFATTAGTRSTPPSTPEPSTWVMMALGFVGLGYAAIRRRSKDRSALAI